MNSKRQHRRDSQWPITGDDDDDELLYNFASEQETAAACMDDWGDDCDDDDDNQHWNGNEKLGEGTNAFNGQYYRACLYRLAACPWPI